MRGAIRTPVGCLCVAPLLFLASCQSSNHKIAPGRESVSARPDLNLLLVTIDTLRADRRPIQRCCDNKERTGNAKIESPFGNRSDQSDCRVDHQERFGV